jgi:Leucine-rich repeat (LRR) protein
LRGSIPSSLGNLRNLVNLLLENNQLTGSIPSSLGNLSNLVDLYLNNNQLTGSIPSSLGNLSKALYSNLYSNQLTGSIPSSLGNLKFLIICELFNNELSGSIPSKLFSGSINKLLLYNNMLIRPAVKFGCFPSLQLRVARAVYPTGQEKSILWLKSRFLGGKVRGVAGR